MNIIKKLFLTVALFSIKNTNTSSNFIKQALLRTAQTTIFASGMIIADRCIRTAVWSFSNIKSNKLSVCLPGIGVYCMYKSINYFLNSRTIRENEWTFLTIPRRDERGEISFVSISLMNEEETRKCSKILTTIIAIGILIETTSLLKK